MLERQCDFIRFSLHREYKTIFWSSKTNQLHWIYLFIFNKKRTKWIQHGWKQWYIFNTSTLNVWLSYIYSIGHKITELYCIILIWFLHPLMKKFLILDVHFIQHELYSLKFIYYMVLSDLEPIFTYFQKIHWVLQFDSYVEWLWNNKCH